MYIPTVSEICVIIKLISKIVFITMLILYLVGGEKIPKYFAEHKTCSKIVAVLMIIGYVSTFIDIMQL